MVKVCCLRHSPHDRWRAAYHYDPAPRNPTRRQGRRASLSKRARATVDWLREFRAQQGRWPCLAEAAAALGMTRRGFERHLGMPIALGLVRLACGPGRAKAVELTGGDHAV